MTTTMPGEVVRMGFDMSALTHLMNVVTDLYSDPELAALREIATNALDAHVEAGNPAPIEVTTPSELRPTLVVRDYGVGLDAEGIRTIYSQYGASTKREADDVVGMLGLGCKSPLAYADQFTLTGVRDGTEIVVAISRDDTGAGTMTIVSEEDTDAPNGVTVTIPARADHELTEKAAALFAYWPAGTVLVDGKAPERLTGFELSPTLQIIDRTAAWENARAVVVMGGVPYPAPELSARGGFKLPNHKALIARVPIGAVDPTPSREALQDSPATQATVTKIVGEMTAAKATALQAAIDRATTRAEAVRALGDAQDALAYQADAPCWNGHEIPATIDAPSAPEGDAADYRFWWLPDTSSYYRVARSTHSRERAIPAVNAIRAVWVLGYELTTWTAARREKLTRYVGEAGVGLVAPDERAEFVMTRMAGLPNAWVGDVRTVTWEDVRAWKDPEASLGGGGECYAGTYPTYTKDGWSKRYPAANIADADGPVYYVVGHPQGHSSDFELLREVVDEDALLVELSATREPKFRRTFPEARELRPELEKHATAWYRGLTKRQRGALATFTDGTYNCRYNFGRYGANDTDRRRPDGLRFLDPARVADPELAEWLKLADAFTSELQEAHQRWKRWLPGESTQAVEDPSGRFPLLSSDDRATLDHRYLYIDAVHAAEKSEA